MRARAVAASVMGCLLLVAGCSSDGTDEPSPGTTPGDAATATDGAQNESGNFVEALGGATVSFGEPVEYDDGLSITLSPPKKFTPSPNATTGQEENHVKFTVHMVNGSGKKVAPADVSVMVESQGGQAGDVIDAKRKMTGPPAKAVKPGEEASWILGFGVLDPTDVAVVVQAGIGRIPVVFTR